MTTTVKILIEGNKKCSVRVIEEDLTDSKSFPARDVMPGSFTTVSIHGEQKVSVREEGEFLS